MDGDAAAPMADSAAHSTSPAPGGGQILIFGSTSIIGWSLHRGLAGSIAACNTRNRHPRAARMHRANIDDRPAVRALIERLRPEVVINAGGICDVDRCEEDPTWAERINIGGTLSVLDALPADVRLVQCSSDHVFGSGGPEAFDEDTLVAPISVYGALRVEAEELVQRSRPDALILRIPLIIGPSLNGRVGHLDWLRYRIARDLPCTVVADECRHAVPAAAFAARVADLIAENISGIVHIRTTAPITRPALARHLLAAEDLPDRLALATRAQQHAPHLGRIDLGSRLDPDRWPALPAPWAPAQVA